MACSTKADRKALKCLEEFNRLVEYNEPKTRLENMETEAGHVLSTLKYNSEIIIAWIKWLIACRDEVLGLSKKTTDESARHTNTPNIVSPVSPVSPVSLDLIRKRIDQMVQYGARGKKDVEHLITLCADIGLSNPPVLVQCIQDKLDEILKHIKNAKWVADSILVALSQPANSQSDIYRPPILVCAAAVKYLQSPSMHFDGTDDSKINVRNSLKRLVSKLMTPGSIGIHAIYGNGSILLSPDHVGLIRRKLGNL
jgi:hypothetical protein